MIWWRALCRHDHLNPPSVTMNKSFTLVSLDLILFTCGT